LVGRVQVRWLSKEVSVRDPREQGVISIKEGLGEDCRKESQWTGEEEEGKEKEGKEKSEENEKEGKETRKRESTRQMEKRR
jgi:hypothetical protein